MRLCEGESMSVQAVFVLTLTAAAMMMDIASGKIANLLCFAGWIGGFAVNLLLMYEKASVVTGVFSGSAKGFPRELVYEFMRTAVFWAAGCAVPFLLGFPLFRFRMIGAGDVKLLMAVGGMIGPASVLLFLAVSVVCGAFISVLLLLGVVGVRERFAYFMGYLEAVAQEKRILPYRGDASAEFHFSAAIFMAALLYAGGMIA